MDVQMVAGASAIGTAVVGGLLYLIRTEQAKEIARVDGRIARHEAECEQRNVNADERHKAVTQDLTEIKGDVKDILRHMALRQRSQG